MAEDGTDAVVPAKGSIETITATIPGGSSGQGPRAVDASQKVNSDAVTICHGGHIPIPDGAQCVNGFSGVSSID